MQDDVYYKLYHSGMKFEFLLNELLATINCLLLEINKIYQTYCEKISYKKNLCLRINHFYFDSAVFPKPIHRMERK